MAPFHPLPARPGTSSWSQPPPPAAGPSRGGFEHSPGHQNQHRIQIPPFPSQYSQSSQPGGRSKGQDHHRGGGGRGRGRGRGRGQHGYHGGPTQSTHDGFRQQRPPAPYEGDSEQRPHHSASASPFSSRPKPDGPPDATIQGLNIQLDHPLLVEHWIAERKKRWPTKAVIAQKEKDAVWRLPGSASIMAAQRRKRQREEEDEAAAERRAKRANQRSSDTDSDDTDDGSDSMDDSGSNSNSSDSSSEDGHHPDADDNVGGEEEEEEEEEGEDHIGEKDSGPIAEAGPPIQPTVKQSTSSAAAASSSNPGPALQPESRSNAPRFVPQEKKFRSRPRGPPTNPFARSSSDLLHALLRREIASHTDAVLQFFRFLVLNSFLVGVERKRGDAEEALRRANLIVETTETSSEQGGGGSGKGKGKGKAKAVSVELKPLISLSFPPAPDPLIFLDPLRALEPYPLTHEQLVAFCEDEQIREVLGKCTLSADHDDDDGQAQTTGSSTTTATKARESGLTTAIRTLDALPTPSHRTAALELILHIVDEQQNNSPTAAARAPTSAAGAIWHPPPSMNNNRAKPISETELFRLGLRVGPEQLADVRTLAERVSVILEKVPVYSALPDALKEVAGVGKHQQQQQAVAGSAAELPPSSSSKASKMGAGVYEARGVGWQQLEWEREWERRETLRRLGIRLE